MASYDDDADPAVASQDEDEDEEMEDVNDPNQDEDQEQDDDQNGDEDEEEENDNEDDGGSDEDEPDSPSRRASEAQPSSSRPDRPPNPAVVLTSPSPRTSGTARSPANGTYASFIPPTRPEALTAQAYDIVPTMAAPQSTSINAIAVTPDMKWVFSGGTDGYVRMYNWV